MDFTHAQTSALAQSTGLGLQLIADMSQLQSDNYELQKSMLKQENASAGVSAQAMVNAGNQDSIDMTNQAYGDFANAGFGLVGSVSGGLYEGKQYGKVSACDEQMEALQNNEEIIDRANTARTNASPEVRLAGDEAGQNIETKTKAAQKKANSNPLTRKDDLLSQTDVEKLSEGDSKALARKAQSKRRALTSERRLLEDQLNSRRQQFMNLFQAGGGAVKASFELKSADAKKEAAEERALSQMAQYSSTAAQGAFQADSQGNNALAAARDAEYQNLQIIARSNQPN